MSALTKANLAEHLYGVLGFNKREAKDLVELFLTKSVFLWKMNREAIGFWQF